MRIVSFPLNLRTETPDSSPPAEAERDSTSLPSLPEGSSPAYVPLLAASPFTPPAALSRPSGLPSNPRLSLPSSQNMRSELQVTPDTLRYLGSVVEHFTAEIRDVQLAYRALIVRTELQRREYERQQETCRAVIARIENIRGKRREELQTWLKGVQDNQGALLGRMDGMLQKLITNASPELNEHETKWFEELQRMKRQVLGGRYDHSSLHARVQLVGAILASQH